MVRCRPAGYAAPTTKYNVTFLLATTPSTATPLLACLPACPSVPAKASRLGYKTRACRPMLLARRISGGGWCRASPPWETKRGSRCRRSKRPTSGSARRGRRAGTRNWQIRSRRRKRSVRNSHVTRNPRTRRIATAWLRKPKQLRCLVCFQCGGPTRRWYPCLLAETEKPNQAPSQHNSLLFRVM